MVPGISKSKTKKKLEKKIRFEYFAPQAERVALGGDFNQWDPSKTPLAKDAEGKWKVEINLPSGRYEYRYQVDGNWQNEQKPVECVPNPFGSWNCVVEIQ